VEFLVPFARPAHESGGRELASRRPPDPTHVIAFIDNGKSHANEFLAELGKALVARGVAGSYFLWRKPTASKPITTEERSQLLARAHLVVSGIGD